MIRTNLKKNTTILAIAFSVFISLPVFAQSGSVNTEVEFGPEQVLSLEQALEVAVANNPDIQRAMFAVMDADEQIRMAWGEVLPTISTGATYQRNIEVPINFLPAEFFGGEPGELIPVAFGTDNNWTGGVTVSQNIFRGQGIVGISSSALFKSVQEENLRTTIQQIITDTRKAYYNVLIARERLRLQEASIRRIQENLNVNVGRQRAGLGDEYDVLRLEVQLANQEPVVRESQYQVQQAYRNLKLVLGVPLELPFDVTGNLNQYEISSSNVSVPVNESLKTIDQMTPLPANETANSVEVMQSQRGDLRLLNIQDELKDREILAIKSQFLPTLTANYNLQWTSAQGGSPVFFKDARRYQTLSLTLDFPLFEGFQRRVNLNRALIEKKDINEQQLAAERAAQHEYESSVENLNRIFDSEAASERALIQARRGYEIALQRYERGLGSQLEVTEAELQVREAEINYAEMVYDYLSAKADYDLSLGIVPLTE